MKKNIKRIIALTLILSVYSALEPTKYINLTSTEVYAETDTGSIYLKGLAVDDADIDFDSNKTFYNINVDEIDGSAKIIARPKSTYSQVKINGEEVTSSDKYKKEINLDEGENVVKITVDNNESASKTYTLIITRGKSNWDNIYLSNISLSAGNINFQKETGSYNIDVKADTNKIKIKAKPEDINDTVEIDGEEVESDNGYEKTVDLEKDKNEIIVQVENTKKKRSYKLNINRQYYLNNPQDNIYLDFIKVSNIEIQPSKDKTSYDVKVNESIDGTTVRVQPESDKYMVEINEDAVEASENYEKDIDLNKTGKTEVKIKIEDSNKRQRIYTLNIYKGEIPVTTANQNGNIEKENSNIIKRNQWVQINNKWQYNDEIGNTLKNAWFYDRNYGKTYYLQTDGTMATGWLNNNGKWYYLGIDGAMKTGWILDGNKYYYLYSDGSMAYGTKINGYRLDKSGAWTN